MITMRNDERGPVAVMRAVLRYLRSGLCDLGQWYFVTHYPGQATEPADPYPGHPGQVAEPADPCPGHPERLVIGRPPSAEERGLWAQFGDSGHGSDGSDASNARGKRRRRNFQ